jgi:hypothetical protein
LIVRLTVSIRAIQINPLSDINKGPFSQLGEYGRMPKESFDSYLQEGVSSEKATGEAGIDVMRSSRN